MRRQRKQKQQEDFVPLDRGDLKYAIEIPIKQINEDNLIKIERKGKGKMRKINLKTRSINEEIEDIKYNKVEEKYQLILCEKPQAALKIATALGRYRKFSEHGAPYYELERNNKKIIVACAVGHLFTLTSKEKGYPIFNIEWQPNFKVKKQDWSKKYYSLLLKLVKNASEFIIASVDYNEITLILEKKEIKILKIGEVVEDILKNKKKISDIQIPTFNSKGKINFNNLKKAIRHIIKEDLYELSLNYGRKVRLTSSHNIFTLKDNKIKMLKTTDLKLGDKILCPATLPIPKTYQKELNLLNLKKFDSKREIFVEGKSIAKILKDRIMDKKRKNSYLNEDRIILTSLGTKILKQKRKNLGYSTSEAAKRGKISQSLVVMWENKQKNPSKKNLIKYLNVLKLNQSFVNNLKYCKLIYSSFQNLLNKVFNTQFKEFSNLKRAIIRLDDLNENELKKIKKAHIYGSKNKRNKLPFRLPVDKELVRLMGYYLAEGDINNDYRIRFSLGLKGYGHEDRIIEDIKKFCGKYNIEFHQYIHKRIKHQVITIDNCVLALLFNKVFKFGNKASNKRVPSLIFNLPIYLKKEFLRAYFLGDGSLSKINISFNTSSELLTSDLSYLLLQLGILTSIYKTSKTGKGGGPNWHIMISGSRDLKKIKKIWQNHHRSRILKLSDSPMEKRNIQKYGDLALIKIKKIKKIKSSKKYVYDLSVEGENFIAGNGGICCHNTDYDIEGEVIGWNIIRFITKQKDAKRMKFSALTTEELQESYKNLMPTIDWGQAIAGETRHFLDWMYGINLSRALMSAIQKAGSFKIMSIGRVQGPALNLIVQKELEIQKFKPQTYWQIFIKLKNHSVELKYEKDIFDKKSLENFKNLEGKKGIATTEKTKRNLIPPFPFDLTSLQREAYRLFGINPSRTLQIAQNLYLAGLISYPRTSSQKIPFSIQPLKILNKLKEKFPETKFVTKQKPIEGKKSDPAHPSIYPTGEFSELDKEEEKIYNLITKRFISCFCQDAEIEDKKIIFIETSKLQENNSNFDSAQKFDSKKISDNEKKLKFLARGLEIKEKGWMNVYPAFIIEKEIEDINGEKIIEKERIEEKLTQPPRRYTPASIITELERKNLGTKATRANIIETLYNRNYIKEQAIQATPLGINLIKSLEKFSPIIIDEKLTRHFEKEMDSIQTAKKNLPALENKTIKEAKETITKISEDLKKNEEKIGKELVKANQEIYKQERESNTLQLCDKCKKGNLRILFNKKFRRYFVACSNYPECKTTFSLPPGLIKRTDKICEKCGFPLLLRIQKGKRPWEFCFNEKNHPDFKGFSRDRKIQTQE